MDLSTDDWILLGVMIAGFIGLVIGSYTRQGSGVTYHPYGGRRSPAARGPSDASGKDPGETSAPEHGTR